MAVLIILQHCCLLYFNVLTIHNCLKHFSIKKTQDSKRVNLDPAETLSLKPVVQMSLCSMPFRYANISAQKCPWRKEHKRLFREMATDLQSRIPNILLHGQWTLHGRPWTFYGATTWCYPTAFEHWPLWESEQEGRKAWTGKKKRRE